MKAQKMKEESVPENVKGALSKVYQGKGVEWSQEDSSYEATFDKSGVETSLVIDADGNIVETETEIKTNDLPASIVNSVRKDYADYKIKEAAKIVAADGKVSYEAEVHKGKETYDLLFDRDGKLIAKESKEDNN